MRFQRLLENIAINTSKRKRNTNIITVLDTIGRKRGCLMKGNEVDYDKVYTIIINDLKEGKIGKVTFDRI